MTQFSDHKDVEKLSGLLVKIKKPTLSDFGQANLRKKIRLEIRRHEREIGDEAWYAVLQTRLSEIGREVMLPINRVFLLKEKLLAMLPASGPISLVARIFAAPLLWLRKMQPLRLAAPVTLGLFILFLFSTFFFTPSLVEASPATYIADLEGKVEIIRNGKSLQAAKNTKLKAKDIVRTSGDSKATIHFLDDSITRLSENTELRIRKLFINAVDPTKTVVELDLLSGILYARVLSLIDEFSRFQVRAENTVSTAKKRASFHVAVKEKGKAQITAVQNSVEVSVVNQKKQKVVETTLLNGYQMDVTDGKPKVSQAKPSEEIGQNLTQDKVYIQELIARDREERLKVDSKPVLPSTVRASEAKLVQAELILSNLSVEEAGESVKTLLAEFVTLAVDVGNKAREFEKTDPLKAKELREEFDRRLQNYKKQFALLLPDDPLYPLKEAIAHAELALTETPAEAAETRLEQASEKLLEAQTLAESGKTELATEQLQAFTDAVTTVVSDTAQLETAEEKDEVVSAMLDKKTDHLKLLEALSAEIKLVAPPALSARERRGISFQEVIAKAKKDSLEKTGEALATVSSSGGTPSAETLKKVEELKETDVNLEPLVTNLSVTPLNTGTAQNSSTAQESTLSSAQSVQPSSSPSTTDIKSDPSAGVTVITIEAKPSAPKAPPLSTFPLSLSPTTP